MAELITRIALFIILAVVIVLVVIFMIKGIPEETRSGQDRINRQTIFGAFSADSSRLISAVCTGDDYEVVVDVQVFTEEEGSFNYTVIGDIDNKIVRGLSGGKNKFGYPGERSVSVTFDINDADDPVGGKNFLHMTLWESTICIDNYFEENPDDPKFFDLLSECGNNYLSAISFDFTCGEGSIISTPIDGIIFMEGIDVQPGATHCRPRIAVKNTGTRAWTADDEVKIVVQCVPGQPFSGVYIPLPENGYLTLDPGESYFSPLDLYCDIISPTNRKSAILYENCQNPNSPAFCASGDILESTTFRCNQAYGPGGIDCRDNSCSNPKLNVQWDKIKYWLMLCIRDTTICTNTLTNPDVCDFGQTTENSQAKCELAPNIPYTVSVMASPDQDSGPFGGYEYRRSENVQCSGSGSLCDRTVSWPRISYNVQLVRHETLIGSCSQRTDPLCDDSLSTTGTSIEFQGLAPLTSYDAYVTVNAGGRSRLHAGFPDISTEDCNC